MKRTYKPVFRVVFIYILFSIVWILVTDQILEFFVQSPDLLTMFQSYKGTAFIFISGILLYLLLVSEMKKREDAWNEYDQVKTELLKQLARKTSDLEQAYNATIEGWARAMDMRNRDVHEHSQRVTDLTLDLARRMGLSEEELAQIRRGSLLHDIGKMSIPDEILLKNGPLSDQERLIIEQHPRMADEMLSPIQFLQPALDIPRYHHERWDGSGYPYGLKGTEIPLAARIFSVVDVWDALTSDRSYRNAMNIEDVRDYIAQESGKSFDPQVVDAFLELLQEIYPAQK